MRREAFNPWQSFSDLAMGLMAVFILVLLGLLHSQAEATNVEAERAEMLARRQAQLLEAQRQLIEARRQVAELAISLASASAETLRSRDNASDALRQIFESSSDCKLRLDSDGELVFVEDAGREGVGLYGEGETAVGPEARQRLQQCASRFRELACMLMVPLTPTDGGDAECTDALRICERHGESLIARATRLGNIAVIRTQLEAIVLEGNTDRKPLTRTPPPRIVGGSRGAASDVESFVENAYLGSERARQALGHILAAVGEPGGAPSEGSLPQHCALDDLLMSRIRVESPSYGRTLAGPRALRLEQLPDGECNDPNAECAPARSLKVRFRLKEEALRRPMVEFQEKVCAQLDEGMILFEVLAESGTRMRDLRAKLGCLGSGHDKR
jgi:hypothetical protein